MNPRDFLPTAPGRTIGTGRDYWAFVPDPLPPALKWTPALVSLVEESERLLAQLAEIGMNFPSPHTMVRAFIHLEAVLSSRIEGTRTSLEQLYTYEALLFSHIETRRTSLKQVYTYENLLLTYLSSALDAHAVYNYVRALDDGLLPLERLPVSLRLIRELHCKLMEGVGSELLTPGEFRRTQNWIGPPGSTLSSAPYVPPPVDEMHAALDLLERFIHAPSDLPALVRIGLIHYQFEAIHPFLDGNGRVGRLLLTLLLCEWKLLPLPLLYISAYFEANRQEYYARLLAVSQRGDWEGWLGFFLAGVRDQARSAAERVRRLQDLRQGYDTKLRGERDVERLMRGIDFLTGHPLVSVRQVQAGLGASEYKIAQRILQKLEQAGIAHEITGQARNRLYRADEILAAVEGPVNLGEGK